jgi:UTP--glucose-1-phosphate uridylyltransferase
MMHRRPEVCILPVAGLSTRNLPSTKALHKGFLTLNSKPIIQYAVDCCAEIGIKEIVFIYSDQSCKHLFEKHFAPYPWLENHLKEKNKLDLLKVVQEIIPEGMKFSFAEQAEPKGNGHAVLMAKEIVGKRDFVVMWPDDVYVNFHGEGILKQLLNVYEELGGMVENIMEFPREQMVRYGALIGAVRDGRIVHAKGKIEKPALEDVPSNYASMGPYILPNEIMDILPEVRKGNNGEINLADAMGLAAVRGMKLTGVLCDALRFDCGTNEELAKSNLKLSLMMNPDLRAYCKEVLNNILV